ncbi:GerAB/ArcD/ProY family transporter [Lederbergia wuyishanensis]|uniref:Spore germination protein (Amino acid permease) n=1 Tax=Lederbergia wuyishanensis TaxID=1347903 RepID=A0ABU0D9D9_9BACI|nr:GerAB/ArcD/ProY family transporter [Lederbergia wuyishanensis]MCJ8009391.1 spore germination protein [Lederbergia wuyishanensis]MDQ0345000.1 spore germination protein (amino acid permease) [Lederbergia wuyishanensis]
MSSTSKGMQLAPYLVFFLVHSMQIGIGVLGYQRQISKTAGYDTWISVLLACVISHIVLFIIYKIAEIGKGDLNDTHTFTFGRILGGFFNIVFSFYFIAIVIGVIRSYIEILQIWLFPDLRVFWFTFIIVLLAIYVVNGGIRTVTGIAFYSIIIPFYLYFAFLFAVPYSDYSDFLPVLHHSFKDIFKATGQLAISYLGYETLLYYYPFIQNPKKSKKWAHLALLFTCFIYLYITFISFGYYSEPQLQHIIWATLSIWKIVKLSFMWRFEYIGIATWFFAILPNICIPLWCASRIMKKTFKMTQRSALIWISALLLFLVPLLQTRQQIYNFLSLINKAGIFLNFIYIPLLLVIVIIVKKVKK